MYLCLFFVFSRLWLGFILSFTKLLHYRITVSNTVAFHIVNDLPNLKCIKFQITEHIDV